MVRRGRRKCGRRRVEVVSGRRKGLVDVVQMPAKIDSHSRILQGPVKMEHIKMFICYSGT